MRPNYVPVIHAAVSVDRPDEQDTIDTAAVVAEALRQLGFQSDVIDIGLDFAPLRRLAAIGPLAVFNLVEAVGGDGARAHQPVRLMERLGLRYTGATAAACELTMSKTATKSLLAKGRIPTPGWWESGAAEPGDVRVIVKSDSEHASLGIDAASIVAGTDSAAEIARRQSPPCCAGSRDPHTGRRQDHSCSGRA